MNSTIDRLVGERLADSDHRYTAARSRVVRALQKASGPLSTAELYEAVDREIPLSSLYRTVSVLEGSGIVAPHHGAKGVTRYELDEWLTGHHHHIVCVGCGSVEDLHFDDRQEDRFEALVTEVVDAAGFKPSGHALDIEGWCVACL
ncbi:MAG: transcriptional repressor [Acidimicrobiia bacterium]|nr:transcriptional repressor [Acidimicrobiia bacterium]